MASGVQGVHHDIDRELGVVFGKEALVAPIVIPLTAVILVAVKQAETAVEFDAFEVIMHDIVAPAIQFETGGRRFAEAEEAGVSEFLDKPINPSLFYNTILSLL